MSSLINQLKKYPILFRPLSKLYWDVFLPIKSGFITYYVKYSLFEKRNDVYRLSWHQIRTPKPFKVRSWRIGKGKDKAFRRYYMGKYRGENCFIKIATNDSTVKNECRLHQHMVSFSFPFTPKILVIDEVFDDNTVMLCQEFQEGLSSYQLPDTVDEFKQYCLDFLNILKALEQAGIIHADIHGGNLMRGKRNLVLLDFGISMAEGVENDVNYLARPGTFFRQEGNERKYDDAYSIICLLERLKIREEWKSLPEYQKVYQRIDKMSRTVILPHRS